MAGEEITKKAILPTEKLPFMEYVDDKNFRPNPEIVQKLERNTIPFAQNTFFGFNPALLASSEFNRCVELYKNRGENEGPGMAMQLMSQMARVEEPHKEELEEIAIKIVRDMYNVPDSLDLRAFLEKKDYSEEMDDQSEPEEEEEDDDLTAERKLELQPEIEKRRILNSLVHGASIHQWTSAFYIAQEELEEIDPTLMPMYNQYAALVQYWNWQMYYEPMFAAGMAPIVQGINKVNIKEKRIDAMAINFPVLLHELSKGVVDFLISKGIPDLPPKELQYVYREADNYAHEQFHYMMGPVLWRSLLDGAEVTSAELAPIISKLSQMNYEELSTACIDLCFFPDTAGKRMAQQLKK
jgi:hypothetical protein